MPYSHNENAILTTCSLQICSQTFSFFMSPNDVEGSSENSKPWQHLIAWLLWLVLEKQQKRRLWKLPGCSAMFWLLAAKKERKKVCSKLVAEDLKLKTGNHFLLIADSPNVSATEHTPTGLNIPVRKPCQFPCNRRSFDPITAIVQLVLVCLRTGLLSKPLGSVTCRAA